MMEKLFGWSENDVRYGVKKIWVFLWVFIVIVGCGPQTPAPLDPMLAPGSPQAKQAIATVQTLAQQRGYRLSKFDVQLKADPDTGNFMIFLFPKTHERKFDRRSSLFAIVNAKSGQMIQFSDPVHDKPQKPH
jgi:hypothetical protein